MLENSKTKKNLIQVFRVVWISILFRCVAFIISLKIILTLIMRREPTHRVKNYLFSKLEISISDNQYWDFLLDLKAFSFQNIKYVASDMLLFNFWKVKLKTRFYSEWQLSPKFELSNKCSESVRHLLSTNYWKINNL